MATFKEVARLTGYTIHTVQSYHARGILPPPREWRGKTPIFAAEDIRFFVQTRVDGRTREGKKLRALRRKRRRR